jgi:glycosyltransferase involved in cell wall biosynthesis
MPRRVRTTTIKAEDSFMQTGPALIPTPQDLTAGVSVVVPVYNGEATISRLFDEIVAALAEKPNWEVIFVVDGSPDSSWAVVQELCGRSPKVVGINMFRNFGQHNALLAGIRASQFDVVVTMDDDLQHRPSSIPTLLAALSPPYDLVYGSSPTEEHDGFRNLTSRLAKFAMGASIGGQMARDSGALRAFRTSLRGGFSTVSDPYVSIDVLLSWVTTRYTVVNTPMDQRPEGSSGYTIRKLLRHALNMMTGYSTLPLRLASALGFLFSLFGFVTLVFVVVRYITTTTSVQGFAFLASLISILAGAQLFSLGVIGEYLGRVHFRSMQRPPYVVKETLKSQGSVTTQND